MELDYITVGDYLIPALKLSDPPDAPPLGLYGELHKRYLREHRKILYSQLLLSERLYPVCCIIDEAAAHRLRTIPDREQAREIILAELFYDYIVTQNLKSMQSVLGCPDFSPDHD